MSIREFEEKCKNFAECRAELIRLKGLKTVDKAVDENAKVVIVSASIENWVRAFFRQFGLDMVIISGTKIEVKNAVVTGQFIGNNCYGPEKVRRIQELFPDRKQYKLIAFGDSKGDRELLAFADESHYKPFRK
jgi:HAD superfamily phosphoserine phosphatase-like hydrolase